MNRPDLATATEKRDAAYEVKFVVPASVAETVLTWARIYLVPDPHADGSTGDGYRVNSLYFDTARLDVYQRNGSYGKSKYRVRRYGQESWVFLERKLKSRGLVSKRRTRVPDQEICRLDGFVPEADWVGYWFGRRLQARQLQPICQITYERTARVGMTAVGPVRLTVDRDVRAFRTGHYGVVESGSWAPLLPGRCILELKFRLGMPSVFQSLLEQLSLTPQPVSKYRLSIQAFGLEPKLQNAPPVPRNGHVYAGAFAADSPPTDLRAAGSSPES